MNLLGSSTGRPKRDEYEKISVTIDVPLYERIDEEAKRLGLTRSALIERMLEESFFNEKRNRLSSLKVKMNLLRRFIGNNDDDALDRDFMELYLKSKMQRSAER